jgi:septin family protein
MNAIHTKVNIVPVIAKADTLTLKEVDRLKTKVLSEIEMNGIQIYTLPECDSDEDEDYKEQCRQLRVSTLSKGQGYQGFLRKRAGSSFGQFASYKEKL